MKRRTAPFLLLLGVALAAAEPAPRKPAGATIKVSSPLPYISGVAELPDGRLLVSDHRTPAMSVVTPATGAVASLGSAGAGAGQFVRPGGFYGTPGKGFWLLDRGLKRAIAVSPSGTLGESHSVLPRGSSGSSSSDFDLERLDARGMAYYLRRDMRASLSGGAAAASIDLIRFDPAAQQMTTIAKLLQRVAHSTTGGDGMTYSRAVHGSPADGWGVAADGRVAVVRAVPYRVDWYSASGAETKGPVYPVDVIPMTEADKTARLAAQKAGGGGMAVGVSSAPGASATPGATMLFADTKAPFDPELTMVSPAGRVFVPRATPFGQDDAVFDVFDGRGRRVDRIQLPPTSRIVGFPPSSIYVREQSASGAFLLKKYEVK
jgi:hypothetical protein